MTRLFEAEALLDALNSQACADWLDEQDEYTPASIVEHALETLPTVDVAPVRHGKWLYRKFEVFGHEYAGNCYCSACGMDAPTDDGAEYMTRYCPNCGAYMFGEGEEE